ncbi:unnamed protein product, partial [Rotaria socialis]
VQGDATPNLLKKHEAASPNKELNSIATPDALDEYGRAGTASRLKREKSDDKSKVY